MIQLNNFRFISDIELTKEGKYDSYIRKKKIKHGIDHLLYMKYE